MALALDTDSDNHLASDTFVMDAQAVTRFWARVDTSGGPDACWLWQGCLDGRGYGKVAVRGKSWRAHRLAYTLTRGSISAGLVVCHRCDRAACLNPAHLWLGSQADNVRDMSQKGRHGAAKLTATDVRAIRALYATGRLGYFRVARLFGVNKSTIRKIVRGQTWRHLLPFGQQRQPASESNLLKESA